MESQTEEERSSNNDPAGDLESIISLEDGKKIKFKQTVLVTNPSVSSSKNSVGGASKLVLDAETINPTILLPSNFDNLRPFFSPEAASKERDRFKYTMKCLLCLPATVVITDKGISSFVRHLKRKHVAEHQRYMETKSEDPSLDTNEHLRFSSTVKVPKYDRNDPKQKHFEKNLLTYVLVDTVPCSAVHGDGFKVLVNSVDPKLIVPHPTTLRRQVFDEYDKIRRNIKAKLSKASPRTLHFIIDIWTSFQGKSIMGVKVQFVDNWKLTQQVVGLKHFPCSHTAENIKQLIVDFFQKDLEIRPCQVGSITADNAANILAAFKDKYDDSSAEVTSPSVEEVASWIREEMDGEGVTNDDATTDMILAELCNWTSSDLHRNSCLAHLLHLAVKDAIKESLFVTTICKRVTEIVSFFHTHTKWNDKLLAATNNIVPMKPVDTRWSSVFTALKRLKYDLKKDAKTMNDAIRDVLVAAREESNKRAKVPKGFDADEMEAIAVVVELLEPPADFTNKLEADFVTSSVVHLGTIEMLSEIQNTDVVDEMEYAEDVRKFKNSLLTSIMQRFVNDEAQVPSGSKKRGRRIVVTNIYKNVDYILATLLDPRIRTTIFEDGFLSNDDVLFGMLPSKDEVTANLQQIYEEIKEHGPVDRVTEVPRFQTPPPSKKSRTMFSRILQTNVMKQATQAKDEVAEYLTMKYELSGNPEGNCPLKFWNENEDKFPILSKAAKRYLGMPASSGSVERLFSVCAGLGKARAARLLPETIEKILCCQSYYRNKFS